MENENIDMPLNNMQNSKINENDIFILDYENQEIEKNTNFIKWKEYMNNKYNGTKNIYKCPSKKHFFYGEIKDYSILCPMCDIKIRPFCYNPIVDSWFAKCCTKRKVYSMHYQGIEFSNPDQRGGHFYDSETEIVYFVLPGISFLFLIGIFFNAFFYKIVRKNAGARHDSTYEDFLRRKSKIILVINMAFNGFMSIFLLIPFFIFNCGISLLLLILLIIRKKWYMYFIGFLHEDWYFLNKNFKNLKFCHMI